MYILYMLYRICVYYICFNGYKLFVYLIEHIFIALNKLLYLLEIPKYEQS